MVGRRTAHGDAPIQRSDGFWNVNLGDPQHLPGPETSGTAFFTYATAYAVRAGLLRDLPGQIQACGITAGLAPVARCLALTATPRGRRRSGAVVGVALGMHLFNYVDHARVRHLVFALLFVLGLTLCLRG